MKALLRPVTNAARTPSPPPPETADRFGSWPSEAIVIVTIVVASTIPLTLADVRVRLRKAETMPYRARPSELITALVFGDENAPRPSPDSILFPRGVNTQSFYHVHSYYLDCAKAEDVVATIDYSGQDITVAVERENIFGTQFHPEKSQDAGLDLLELFFVHLRNQGRMVFSKES